MFDDLKEFALKLGVLLIAAPVAGFGLLKIVDNIQEAWKTNNRKKKWVAMSTIFAIAAGLAGWLR